MSWPSEGVIAHAFSLRAAEVIRTPLGNGKGVRSADPWVYLIVGPRAFVFCERCGGHEAPPDPPGQAGPGEPRRALLAPGTRAHALHALTWLHGFSKTHRECQETPGTQATLFEGCDPKPLPPSDTLRDELECKRARRPCVVIRKLT